MGIAALTLTVAGGWWSHVANKVKQPSAPQEWLSCRLKILHVMIIVTVAGGGGWENTYVLSYVRYLSETLRASLG